MISSAPTTAKREWYPALVSFVTHHLSLVWLILLTIATAVVYAPSLSYPFCWVDPIDIGLARGSNQTLIKMQSQSARSQIRR